MKKFRERLQGFVVGIVVMALLVSTFVLANSSMREVFYGVNVSIDGVQWNPPADMLPFISEGRTFLPVRGIAEALGVEVDWDAYTQTVLISTDGAPATAPSGPVESDGSVVYSWDVENMANLTVPPGGWWWNPFDQNVPFQVPAGNYRIVFEGSFSETPGNWDDVAITIYVNGSREEDWRWGAFQPRLNVNTTHTSPVFTIDQASTVGIVFHVGGPAAGRADFTHLRLERAE